MAWIESHQSLARHPKVLRLAGTLKIGKAQAIGHLHLLWWWTLDFAPSGALSAFTSCEISGAAEWTGDADKFVSALKETGFIDEDGSLHDWDEYHIHYNTFLERRDRQKAQVRERVRSFRERIKNGNAPVTHHVTQCNAPTVQYITVPTKTKREGTQEPRAAFVKPTAMEVTEYSKSLGKPIDGESFVSFYESKGWVIGKSPMKSWKAAVVTWTKRGNYGNACNAVGALQPIVTKSNYRNADEVVKRLESFKFTEEPPND